MNKNEIADILRTFIIEKLYREELKPEEIGLDSPLFEEAGLGLDSLDAVELACFLEQRFDADIKDEEKAREIFASIGNIADFILDLESKK